MNFYFFQNERGRREREFNGEEIAVSITVDQYVEVVDFIQIQNLFFLFLFRETFNVLFENGVA